MKLNHWTLALAAAGVVTMGTAAQAEEATESVKTLVSGTTISGYVSTSAVWRPGTGNADPGLAAGPTAVRNHLNGAAGTTKLDGFNLDVVDLVISKSLDESEWAAGYLAELWFDGTGTGDSAVLGTGGGPATIKQAYVSLRAPIGNGIDFKMGVFDTIIGYEASNYTQNPNYTRSYAWGVEPFTHTGLLASYRFSDTFAVSAGVANNPAGAGVFNTINTRLATATPNGAESSKQYMGAIELTAPESLGFLSGSKLTVGAVNTQRDATGAFNDKAITHLYAGATLNTPVDAWKVGIAYDYVANFTGVAAMDSSYASVWGLYNSYQATDKLALHLRAEYATGSSGVFTGIAGNPADNDPNEKFLGLTATVDYSLWENVISRLEVRWDRSLTGGGDPLLAANPAAPFGNAASGGQNNSFLVALNVVYKF